MLEVPAASSAGYSPWIFADHFNSPPRPAPPAGD
jgi:hypothetical protein